MIYEVALRHDLLSDDLRLMSEDLKQLKQKYPLACELAIDFVQTRMVGKKYKTINEICKEINSYFYWHFIRNKEKLAEVTRVKPYLNELVLLEDLSSIGFVTRPDDPKPVKSYDIVAQPLTFIEVAHISMRTE